MTEQEQLMHGAKGLKYAADTVAVAGLPLAVFDSPHLPGIYTFLGIIWLAIRIYETKLFRAARQQMLSAIRRWAGY